MSSIDLQVKGMTCGACVRHVSQALGAIVGVEAVDVDLDSGQVRVHGSPDSTILLTVLDHAGYSSDLASQTAPPAEPKTGCGGGCGCR